MVLLIDIFESLKKKKIHLSEKANMKSKTTLLNFKHQGYKYDVETMRPALGQTNCH